jgi:DNA-binding NarL/FixJ family response regulator
MTTIWPMPITNNIHRIVLAGGDRNDCLLFNEVLTEIQGTSDIFCVRNAHDLMELLKHLPRTPDVAFLNMNMPAKGGLSCLAEIRSDLRFLKLPVIIVSDEIEQASVDKAFRLGARLFIQKPDDFHGLKMILQKALSLDLYIPPQNDDAFVLRSDAGKIA